MEYFALKPKQRLSMKLVKWYHLNDTDKETVLPQAALIQTPLPDAELRSQHSYRYRTEQCANGDSGKQGASLSGRKHLHLFVNYRKYQRLTNYPEFHRVSNVL